MQQNINPENEPDQSTEAHHSINCKVLKIKGKPFWFNVSANKRKTYSRFKTDSQASHFDYEKSYLNNSKQEIKHLQGEESYAQSIQSYNQNYDEDFESYKSTIQHENSSDSKLPYFNTNNSKKKNLNLQVSRLEISILKTPQKRQNEMILKQKIVDKINKIPKKNLKTEPAVKSQQNFSITKEMFMNRNTIYLRSQNQKMIRKIQDIRKVLPVMIKNHHEIFEQQVQIKELKEKINKILSVQYEFQLDENKLELKIRQKQLEHFLREIFSPKHEKKQPTYVNDHAFVPPSRYSILRQEFMNKIRMHILREEKYLHLTKKIKLFEEILEKLSAKERLQSFSSMENRKLFLEWDSKRLKNEFDLKIIQEKVQIESLKDQIKLFDLRIARKNQILQNLKIQSLNREKNQVKKTCPNSPNPDTSTQMSEELQLAEEKNKAIKTFIFKKKKIEYIQVPTQNTSQSNNSFILQKQRTLSQHFSLVPSPSLNQVSKSRINSFDKHESLRKKRQLQKCNKNLNIRIKKSVFRNEGLSQELQELKI